MYRDETIDIVCENETRTIQTSLKIYDDEVHYRPGEHYNYNKYQVEVKREGENWTPTRICRMHCNSTQMEHRLKTVAEIC